jgi:hypothetical protein
VLKNKAVLKYAQVNGLKAADVDVKTIQDHQLGIQGWADMQVSVQLNGQRPANKSGKVDGMKPLKDAKPAKAAGPAKPKNEAAQLEKECKELLGRWTQQSVQMKKLQERKDADDDIDWSWSDNFFERLTGHKVEFDNLDKETHGFVTEFAAAFLTASGLRMFKKEAGDSYFEGLVNLKAKLKPLLDKLEDLTSRMKKMADSSTEPPANDASAKKKRRKM